MSGIHFYDHPDAGQYLKCDVTGYSAYPDGGSIYFSDENGLEVETSAGAMERHARQLMELVARARTQWPDAAREGQGGGAGE